MHPLRFMLAGLQATGAVAALVSLHAGARSVARDLASLVPRSPLGVQLRARWTDYDVPVPAVVVNVTSEKDLSVVIKYCTRRDIPFAAQNGGNGWAAGQTDLGSNGVLINLAGLNQVTISADKNTATIGGGAIIGEVIAAADAAGVLVHTGNCNCVGALGAALGGGYGNLVGEKGLGVDNILSMRVVTAKGDLITISNTSYPDLFWATRGAAANFVVVASATVNAWPTPHRTSLILSMTFDPSCITAVAQAFQDLPLLPQQVVYLILTNSGDAANTPMLLITGFLRGGTPESARAAYAPLFALGPLTQSTVVTPYAGWNAANDPFCVRGGRKQAFSTALNNMRADTWPEIWALYTRFQNLTGAHNSAILIERYNLAKARSVPSAGTAVQDALRSQAFANGIAIAWYDNPSLDSQADDFGSSVRKLWSFTPDPKNNPTYINFASGSESPEGIYGNSLGRLRQLKHVYDPDNVFNQWFNIE